MTYQQHNYTDSYYNINYYDDVSEETRTGPTNEEESCRDPIQHAPYDVHKTPRASAGLEDVVRRRTPAWISKLLKTHIREDVELEELFANCWLLGRIAEVLLGILEDVDKQRCHENAAVLTTQSPLRSPLSSNNSSFSLGERPYRAMVQDFEAFMELCDRLEIREECRFTMTDVDQKREGEKIGMCIWDISNVLHDKSMTADLPEYIGRIVPKFTDPEVQSPSPMKSRNTRFLTPVSKRKIPYDVPVGYTSTSDMGGILSDQEDMDGSTRVLASILTSNKSKPRHAKLLDAVMMTDFCDDPLQNIGEKNIEGSKSPLPKIVDRLESQMNCTDDNEKQSAGCLQHARDITRDDNKRERIKESRQTPGDGGNSAKVLIVGISIAAGYILALVLTSRKVPRSRKSTQRRDIPQNHDMEGRW